MNGIIARIDLILSSDGWKRTAMLQILRDELVEKRDAAIKAEEEREILAQKVLMATQGNEIPVIGTEVEPVPEKRNIVGQETLKVEIKDGEVKTDWVEHGKDLVDEFDKS